MPTRSRPSVDGRGAGRATSRSSAAAARFRRAPAAPVLVRHLRNGVEESVHRGHVVEVDLSGRIVRAIGDPEHLTNLRSAVKPFGVVALLEAGADRAFGLEPAELAIMASSHSGEDLHVRTLQALYRRTGISQANLACGVESAPLDQITATRLARDGERPGQIRHMCSGQHSGFLLLCKLGGWSPEGYWEERHPSQVALRGVVARAFRTTPEELVMGIDACGINTYAFPLREIAWAYGLLGDPDSIPSSDPRSSLAPHFRRIRDAMLEHPELVGGTHDRLDTSLMKAMPGRLVAKGGAEALRSVGILSGPRGSGAPTAATGMAVKIEDGDGFDRAGSAATIEALRQAGVVEGQALRTLNRYHHPTFADSHGRLAAESVPEFELAPIGELVR
ncbi:MAG TPA: asparaginase [Candidatus Limnocylindrales bacterium]|nr:asparaginase [Candidatus Limnocylindrales bacterium]